MNALVIIETLFLLAVALFTLSFVISSIWEREARAALLGGVAFLTPLGGVIALFALRAAGLFQGTLPHRMITELVARNQVARPIFSSMDDLFCGKNPKPASPPQWASFGKSGKW